MLRHAGFSFVGSHPCPTTGQVKESPPLSDQVQRPMGHPQEFASLIHGAVQSGVDILDDGFCFRPESEQKDLAVAEYGNTIVTLDFVFNEVDERLGIRDIVHRPAHWWNHQGLSVMKKKGERRVSRNALSPDSHFRRNLQSIEGWALELAQDTR